MGVSVTDSNRRVRTRTHGGVAGVGGQPPPLCRSTPLNDNTPSRYRVALTRLVARCARTNLNRASVFYGYNMQPSNKLRKSCASSKLSLVKEGQLGKDV